MRTDRTRIPSFPAILVAACASLGLAEDKPGPSQREVDAQNRAIREQLEQNGSVIEAM